MYLSLSLSSSLYLSLSFSFCWSGHVSSSLWSNVSKVTSLQDCSLKVFSKCLCLCLCHCHCLCLFFARSSLLIILIICLKGHMSLELLSGRVLYLYLSLSLSLYLSLSSPFFGQVISPHHSDQMSQGSQVSRVALWRCSLNAFVFVGQFMSPNHSNEIWERGAKICLFFFSFYYSMIIYNC